MTRKNYPGVYAATQQNDRKADKNTTPIPSANRNLYKNPRNNGDTATVEAGAVGGEYVIIDEN